MTQIQELSQKVQNQIRKIPDFPKDGILFLDITTFLSTQLFSEVILFFASKYAGAVDYVAGIESRGFIFGSAIAYALNVGFVPIRKPHKLPYKCFTEDYNFEYGKDSLAIHEDAFCEFSQARLDKPSEYTGSSQNILSKKPKVLLVDDLIATGGSTLASCKLIEKAGGEIYEACFLIELTKFEASKRLSTNIFSLVKV